MVKVPKGIVDLFEDLSDPNLPADTDAFGKIKCRELTAGMRVWWYYEEDVKPFVAGEVDPRDFADYSGVVVPIHGVPAFNAACEVDPDECVIVIDHYPTDKDYPEVQWVALKRLINDNNLLEIFIEK